VPGVTLLAFDPYLREWLDLLLRWLHVIAAIAWIGSSFYFVLLDQSLRPPAERDAERRGVAGELWEVHGGGFYHVQKYRVAPPVLPSHVAWFKWEAYTTWLSGFGLLIVLYYLDARASLIDPAVAALDPWQAIALSVGLLVIAWLAYDVLCRTIRDGRALGLALAGGVALAAWGSAELFGPRAAWLQVGAMLGTIMAANVFFCIVPAQRELVRAKREGREPDAAPGLEAKRRSVHNNYLTLPVLVTMLAAHFAFLTGRDRAWLILLGLMALGAWARLFFNRRHAGRAQWWIAGTGAAALAVLVLVLRPGDAPSGATPVAFATIEPVIAEHCAGCHAANPTAPGVAAAPAGVLLETREQIERQALEIATVVAGRLMPPGNVTGITDDERALVVEWAR
jgi:uncharacterized membrane protein